MQSGLPRTLLAKEDALLALLGQAGRLMVAFSGGVDSSYLAWAAHRAMGDDCLSVTAVSPSYPDSHRAMAEQIVEQFGLHHRFVDTHEMDRADYRANRPDRCYFCKTEVYSRAVVEAGRLGTTHVLDGFNVDDHDDLRPGRPRRRRARSGCHRTAYRCHC